MSGDTDFDPFAGLDDDLAEAGTVTKAQDDRPKHTCEHCAGSGRWSRNQSRKCHACNGRGWFKTPARQRAKQRQYSRTTKQNQLARTQAAFVEANPGLIEGMRAIAGWNGFAASLVEAFTRWGALTEKQTEAAQRTLAKVSARDKERKAERARNTVEVDLTPVHEMFQNAAERGLKRPTYRAEGLVLSRAPDSGRNAGAIYVKADGDYQGKITPDHKFQPVADALDTTTDALQVIARDPEEAAINYGRATGSCACCGRELTDPVSIEAGIGPVCAANFGF